MENDSENPLALGFILFKEGDSVELTKVEQQTKKPA